MILRIPFNAISILSKFTAKNHGSIIDCIMFKPGKDEGSVRVLALDGHSMLEFFFPNALVDGTKFTPFALNMETVVKTFKFKPRQNVIVEITYNEGSNEVQVRSLSEITLNLKKYNGELPDTDIFWHNLQKDVETKEGVTNFFSVPQKDYEKFFLFSKINPGFLPLFETYGDRTLVRYPIYGNDPLFLVQGIVMQHRIAVHPDDRISYPREAKLDWM